jgi:site-specific DNA-methyltransferase (adenine-specific)/modification methylase
MGPQDASLDIPNLGLPVNHILQGNCIEILKTFPSCSVDLIFADPPYNLQLRQQLLRPDQSRVNAVDDDWDQFADLSAYDRFTRAWLGECRRVLKDDGTIWVIGSYHNIFRVGALLMDLGFWILNDVIWHKTNPMPNFRGTRFQNATETMIWARKSAQRQPYTFNYHAMKHLNDDKQMSNVWHIPLCTGAERIKIEGKKAHSTQKPEALLYRVLLASSNPGDLVLDPFFGSGTTGAVARKLRRNFIGIELEPAYIAVARARIAAIPDTASETADLLTRSKRNAPRVSFGQLIESGYLRVGQPLFSSDRRVTAQIKADAHLRLDGSSGSIHRLAAQIQGKESFNGWDFWFYEDEQGALHSIDHLRERYRAEQMRELDAPK